MFKEKVSEIEFHITEREIDDCIVRMANLITEGYTVNYMKRESMAPTNAFIVTEPYIHINLRRKFDNE